MGCLLYNSVHIKSLCDIQFFLKCHNGAPLCCMHQGTSQKITSLIKSAAAITTDILIWCHFFLPLILATYNDYITLYFHFVIPFGFIFNFFITDIILLVIPRKKLTGFSLHYLGLWTVSIAILMIIYSLF